MKKALFIASIGFLSAGWAIELFPAAVIAEPSTIAQSPAGDVSAPRSDAKPVQVELLNPGVEPRQQLRLKPSLGVKQTTTMAVKMEMEVSTAGRSTNVNKVPTIILTIDTKATKIDANGDIHYDFSYANMEMTLDSQ